MISYYLHNSDCKCSSVGALANVGTITWGADMFSGLLFVLLSAYITECTHRLPWTNVRYVARPSCVSMCILAKLCFNNMQFCSKLTLDYLINSWIFFVTYQQLISRCFPYEKLCDSHRMVVCLWADNSFWYSPPTCHELFHLSSQNNCFLSLVIRRRIILPVMVILRCQSQTNSILWSIFKTDCVSLDEEAYKAHFVAAEYTTNITC